MGVRLAWPAPEERSLVHKRSHLEVRTFGRMTPVLLALIAIVLPLARLIAARWPLATSCAPPTDPCAAVGTTRVHQIDHPALSEPT
jgi:hypothetical protein